MTIPVPNVALTYFTVTQPSVITVDTNASIFAGAAPAVTWVQGTVTFTPLQRVVSSLSLNATIYLDPIVGYFTGDGVGLEMQDGTAGVQLVDNFGLGLTSLQYRVDYQLNRAQRTTPFLIVAPGTGGIVDLNDPAVQIPIID